MPVPGAVAAGRPAPAVGEVVGEGAALRTRDERVGAGYVGADEEPAPATRDTPSRPGPCSFTPEDLCSST